jgi:hypothetical protein
MLIWRGLGYFIAVIIFLVSLTMELTIERFYKDDNYYQTHAWPLALALFTSALIIFTWYNNYLKNEPNRVFIDKDSGSEFTIKRSHDLFFINVKYWPLILFSLSIFQFVIK